MKWLKNWYDKRKKKCRENSIAGAKDEAKRIFQIKEYNSLLWLTCDGQLIAPFTMLCSGEDVNECVALLRAIRDLYAERVVNGNER